MRTAVFALTLSGVRLGRRLAEALEADLFAPSRLAGDFLTGFDRLMDCVATEFHRRDALVFITAAGIAVRAVAPLLLSKAADPAVVVLDPDGRFCISLLSGHIGGANELARRIAGITGGTPVITTATDAAGLPSIDLFAQANQMAIANIEAVRHVNAAILEGRPVRLFDPDGWVRPDDPGLSGVLLERVADIDSCVGPGVAVTWRRTGAAGAEDRLVLHPRCIVAGMGCNRGTAADEILGLVAKTFDANAIARRSLFCVASVAAKQDEAGLLAAAEQLGVEPVFYDADRLGTRVTPNPSETVRKHMGVPSVCEAAALLAAGTDTLLVPKQKTKNATLAIARIPGPAC